MMTEFEERLLARLEPDNRRELEMDIDDLLGDFGGADDQDQLEYHARECLRDSNELGPEWGRLQAAELRRRAALLRAELEKGVLPLFEHRRVSEA